MALRIIRKSASDNHVEIIKGTATEAPRLTIIASVNNPAEAEAFLHWRAHAPEWLRTQCEWVLLRGKDLKEVPRPQLQPQEHSIKIVTSRDTISAGKQRYTLIKESSSPFSLFMESAPPSFGDWLLHTLIHLEKHPDCGAAGPILIDGNTVQAAGWTPVSQAQPHDILWQQNHYPMSFEAGWNPLLQGLPSDVMQHLAPFCSVPALSRYVLLRKQAALLPREEEWESFPEEAWLQTLCVQLRHHQYWIHVLATSVQSNLAPNEVPPISSENSPLAGLYQALGFVSLSPGIYTANPKGNLETEIEAYLATKDTLCS